MATQTTPLLIAHRGASRDAPENTLAAFDLAWQQGADGIEADFRLTGDGRVVCLHDAGSGRTAGVDLAVSAVSLQALKQLDVGRWQGERWEGERIPTLEEVLEHVPEEKHCFIELKCGPEIIEPLRNVLVSSALSPARLRLLAFDQQLAALLKQQLPDIPVCLNMDFRWSLARMDVQRTWDRILAVLERSGADGLSCRDHPLLDEAFVGELQRRGLELHVWTVDSLRAARRYCLLGVDSIMTNRPGWLRSGLETD